MSKVVHLLCCLLGPKVAGALPITIQAEVMQRELETCLKREYTVDSLPLLLHQVQLCIPLLMYFTLNCYY